MQMMSTLVFQLRKIIVRPSVCQSIDTGYTALIAIVAVFRLEYAIGG